MDVNDIQSLSEIQGKEIKSESQKETVIDELQS
jgi:hypothetical protein